MASELKKRRMNERNVLANVFTAFSEMNKNLIHLLEPLRDFDSDIWDTQIKLSSQQSQSKSQKLQQMADGLQLVPTLIKRSVFHSMAVSKLIFTHGPGVLVLNCIIIQYLFPKDIAEGSCNVFMEKTSCLLLQPQPNLDLKGKRKRKRNMSIEQEVNKEDDLFDYLV